MQNVPGNARGKVNEIVMMVSVHSPLKAKVLLCFQIWLFRVDEQNASGGKVSHFDV